MFSGLSRGSFPGWFLFCFTLHPFPECTGKCGMGGDYSRLFQTGLLFVGGVMNVFLLDWTPDLCHTAILQCKCDMGGDYSFQTGTHGKAISFPDWAPDLLAWGLWMHPIIWSFNCRVFLLDWLLISWTLHYGQFLFWVILTMAHCALEYSNELSTVSCWFNSRASFSLMSIWCICPGTRRNSLVTNSDLWLTIFLNFCIALFNFNLIFFNSKLNNINLLLANSLQARFGRTSDLSPHCHV